MRCPKCRSKTRITTTRNDDKKNRVYRHRKCVFKGCGYQFYTAEVIVKENKEFKEIWESTPAANSKGRH